MKKMFVLSVFALMLPLLSMAQAVDDDLYYIPSKKDEVKREVKERPAREEIVIKSNAPTTVVTGAGTTAVVVRDRNKRVRDVDEYNRRYDADDYKFSKDDEGTIYIDERPDSDLDGEWVGGEFNGSADDYEYATRIIRFRNPRYAISVSSPVYWDVVYGLNSWDWNVYTDGFYAYAFPTYSNRLWWDWRYNSFGWGGYPYWNWSWNSYYGPSWSFGWNFGWYGGWGYHHHPYYDWHHGGYHHGGYYGNAYTGRRPVSMSRNYSTSRRGSGSVSTRRPSSQSGNQTIRRGTTSSSRRVVSTRQGGASSRSSVSSGRVVRSGNRHSTYTRPSSTRGNTYNRESTTSGSRSYNRSSGTSSSRSYSTGSSRSSRSYSPERSSSRSSGSSYSSGSSHRSSSGSYSGGGGSSRSSSGGSRRR